MLPQGALDLGGVRIEYKLFVVLAMAVPLLLLMTWIVTKTRVGKAMRAIAQDQDAARLMGINVNRIISFTFGLGGALAGAAGLLYQQVIGTTRYDLGFQFGLIAFTAAVLGGIGNLTGAVLGGVLIGLIKGLNDGVGLGQKWSADGRLHHPDPAHGVPADWPARPVSRGEGVTMSDLAVATPPTTPSPVTRVLRWSGRSLCSQSPSSSSSSTTWTSTSGDRSPIHCTSS